MYLVGRSRVVNPATARAAVPAAIEMGARASQVIDRPVYTWASVLGPDPLTLTWTGRVDHLADVVAADDALGADSGFQELAERHNGLFVGPVVGVVSQVVAGAPTSEPKPYINVTRAVAANGSLGEAMATGLEVAETVTRLTGQVAMFVTPVSGAFGAVGWIIGFDDLGQMEDADATLSTSDEWIKLVDRAGHAYQSGTSSMVLRRLA